MGNDQSRLGREGEIPVLNFKRDDLEENPDALNNIPEEDTCASVKSLALDGSAAPAAGGGAEQAEPIAEGGDGSIFREMPDYRLEKQVLGEGAFGKVRLASSSRTGHKVAVKVIKRKKLNDRAELLLKREVKHHEKLRHPNIVRLHTFIMTPTKYYLVMEFLRGGDLLHYINESPLLSEPLARALFRGLMEGLRFCHQLGIHHRDLKLENLMLTSRDEATMALKIADFGLSDLQTSPSGLSGTRCGSPLYAAPELMTDGAAPAGYNASKSDVWSAGVILYALLASALPFDAEDIGALVRLIQWGVPNSPLPDSRTAEARELVETMLNVDSKARPTADQVLAHAWLREKRQNIKSSVTQIDLADRNTTVHRRGASATTNFYKAMLAQMREEEEGRGPSVAPPLASVGEVTSAEPSWQNGGESSLPQPTPPANHGASAGASDAGREQGSAMTREQLSVMKRQAEAVPGRDVPGAQPPNGEAEQGGDGAPQRRPGAAMTREEWDEIRRHRKKKTKEEEN
ncbi:hypothetical protein AB1Y20_001470 [Prymnesium parvum]|uniref:Protein kinase domain-containing protein n=1 Tax=Prymnesium parvum TaxID=97485 RepID=A0AB34K9N7_PRYPA|mmetsp:Transcript_19657/g.47113  ORF Transcript_19657/g.47113 Transcript_19657/m.47113 type:complete len:516 (-) Transcript_19657:534-2081(-)